MFTGMVFKLEFVLFLQVILSAAPLLSLPDLQSLSEGVCLHDGEFLKLLQKSVCELRGREEPHGHTVLILDKVEICCRCFLYSNET